MIRYSKPKLIVAIVILSVLWLTLRCGIRLPSSGSGGDELRLVAESGRLTVMATADSVSFVPSEDDYIHIEDDGEAFRMSAGSHTLADPGDVIIRIPTDAFPHARLNTTGDAIATGLSLTSLSLSSVNGDTLAEGITADELRLTGVNGDAIARDVDVAQLYADDTNGDIIVEGKAISVDARCVSGDVSLTLSEGDDIDVTTVNGDITITVPKASECTTSVSTAAGRSTRQGVSGRSINCSTVSGSVNIF